MAQVVLKGFDVSVPGGVQSLTALQKLNPAGPVLSQLGLMTFSNLNYSKSMVKMMVVFFKPTEIYREIQTE